MPPRTDAWRRGGRAGVSSAVAIVWRQDEVIRSQAGQDQINSRHPARRNNGRRAAFQLGERICQLVAGRIWHENSVMNYWLAHEPQGNYLLFSNYPDGVAFYTWHNCYNGPAEYSGPYGKIKFPVTDY